MAKKGNTDNFQVRLTRQYGLEVGITFNAKLGVSSKQRLSIRIERGEEDGLWLPPVIELYAGMYFNPGDLLATIASAYIIFDYLTVDYTGQSTDSEWSDYDGLYAADIKRMAPIQ